MSNYLVTDTDLTSVADAIRTKGGTSAQLTFPAGFVSAVEAIETGGGGEDTFAQICNGTTTTYESDELLQIPANVLRTATTLTVFKAPNLKDISTYALGGFRGTVIAMPGFTGNIYNNGYAFSGATTLTIVDIGPNVVRLVSHFFDGATAMNTLILRKTSIVTLNNANAFNNCPFKSGGAGGTIYIPKALYDALGTGTNDYKAATNWSTLDGYGTVTWAQIEGSIYETEYADGTPIT